MILSREMLVYPVISIVLLKTDTIDIHEVNNIWENPAIDQLSSSGGGGGRGRGRGGGGIDDSPDEK